MYHTQSGEKKKIHSRVSARALARAIHPAVCLALRARKSRVKGWFRVACVSGQTMGRPQSGCAPGKHGPAAKLMSVPLMRFRRASTGQQIYDGAARSVILVNWSCGREMLTKSSQRKQLYRPERFRRGSIRRVALRTRESYWRVMGYRRGNHGRRVN